MNETEWDPEMLASHQAYLEASARLPPIVLARPFGPQRAINDALAMTLAIDGDGGPPMADTADRWVAARGRRILCRVHRPTTDGPLPVLVYFHGGGWVWSSVDTHDRLTREYAADAGCAVVSVDYALSPEAVFPQALEECAAVIRWIGAHGAEWGLDATRIALGGDSAGGNLAAVVAILARDGGDLPLAFQLLIYPATDMRAVHPSHATNGKGYLLERETIAYYHDHYIDDRMHDEDWRASPLLHPDLSGLPPSLLLTAGFDPLRDEGLDYADALAAAGNRNTYVCFEREIHGFITMGKVIDEANAAVALCAAELARALAR